MKTIRNIHRKSVEVVTLNDFCSSVYDQLVLDGHKIHVNRYGLHVSGRRTSWRQGYWLAFLGTPIGKTPKIVRTL